MMHDPPAFGIVNLAFARVLFDVLRGPPDRGLGRPRRGAAAAVASEDRERVMSAASWLAGP